MRIHPTLIASFLSVVSLFASESVVKPVQPTAVAESLSHRSASLTILVSSIDTAQKIWLKSADSVGGYFDSWDLYHIGFKIPRAKVSVFLSMGQKSNDHILDKGWNEEDLRQTWMGLQAELKSKKELAEEYIQVLATTTSQTGSQVEYALTDLIRQLEELQGRLNKLEHEAMYANVDIYLQYPDRQPPIPTGQTPFAWINRLGIADLQENFKQVKHCKSAVSDLVPSGFAAYTKVDSKKMQLAIHPQGLLFRTQVIKNQPKADLGFWTKAAENRLSQSGFKAISTDTVMLSSGASAELSKWAAPWGRDDHFYWIMVAIEDDDIHLAEAEGKLSLIEKEKLNLEKTFKNLAW